MDEIARNHSLCKYLTLYIPEGVFLDIVVNSYNRFIIYEYHSINSFLFSRQYYDFLDVQYCYLFHESTPSFVIHK